MKTPSHPTSPKILVLLAGLALLLPCAIPAAEPAAPVPDVLVGGPAPKLKNGKWIQGEPVKELEKGPCYLVEFWATWCGPCRTTIPHLDALHRKFKDRGLVVIGQDVWEQDESAVEPFVKKMGDKMSYRVALDDRAGQEGSMAKTWMTAALANGIPTAFLVDAQGMIAWIGHPMVLQESVIESVLAGKHDLRKAAAEYRKENESGWALAKAGMDLGKAMEAGKWDEAERHLDALAKLMPAEERAAMEQMTRASIAFKRGDDAAGCRFLGKFADDHAEDAMLQNAIAWRLLVDPAIKKRDLDLAEKIAARGVKVSEGKSAAILDTQARALFMNGKKAEAVSAQEQAVKVAGASDDKSALEATLASYRKGELPPVQQ